MKIIKYTTLMLLVLQVGFAQGEAILELTNFNETESTVDVEYTSDDDISGLQFNITGADISGASGGDAAASGFILSASATIVQPFKPVSKKIVKKTK